MPKISEKLNTDFERISHYHEKAKRRKLRIMEKYNLDEDEYQKLYRLYISKRHYTKSRSDKFTKCECGCLVKPQSMKIHKLTKKHSILMESD